MRGGPPAALEGKKLKHNSHEVFPDSVFSKLLLRCLHDMMPGHVKFVLVYSEIRLSIFRTFPRRCLHSDVVWKFWTEGGSARSRVKLAENHTNKTCGRPPKAGLRDSRTTTPSSREKKIEEEHQNLELDHESLNQLQYLNRKKVICVWCSSRSFPSRHCETMRLNWTRITGANI